MKVKTLKSKKLRKNGSSGGFSEEEAWENGNHNTLAKIHYIIGMIEQELLKK